jgi:hypothetical protein
LAFFSATAAVDRCSRDLHDFAFREREPRFRVDRADAQVGLDRRWRIGERRHQIRQKAVRSQRFFEPRTACFRGAFNGVQRQTAHEVLGLNE